MQVQKVQSNNYKNCNLPKFGALNITERGQKLLNIWGSSYPEILPKFDIWKKGLANTKNFDLEIDELHKDLWLKIFSKNHDYPSCEGPLRVHERAKRGKLWVYGTDLIDCGDFVSYSLKFAAKNDADVAYDTLKGYQNRKEVYGSLNLPEKIQYAVDSVKILEQASNHKSTPNVDKLPFRQRLKNAWAALKG